MGLGHSPKGRVFIFAVPLGPEALQVAKELTAKFIETRTVSPSNFAEVFPSVYRVVCAAIGVDAGQDKGDK